MNTNDTETVRLYCPQCGRGDKLVSLEEIAVNYDMHSVWQEVDGDIECDYTGEREDFAEFLKITGVTCRQCFWMGAYTDLVPGGAGGNADAIDVDTGMTVVAPAP
jgi:hypothetical protein